PTLIGGMVGTAMLGAATCETGNGTLAIFSAETHASCWAGTGGLTATGMATGEIGTATGGTATGIGIVTGIAAAAGIGTAGTRITIIGGTGTGEAGGTTVGTW